MRNLLLVLLGNNLERLGIHVGSSQWDSKKMNMIVTGATGQLGRMIVEKLLETMEPNQIGVSVREPKKAEIFQARGIRVRRGDFEDAISLSHAFEGASQVLIISPNITGEAAIRQHRTAFEAAKTVGVKRILYTSHIGSSATSLFPPMLSHAAAENTLEGSGIPFTALRNGFYSSSALMILGDALKTGEIVAPEDGPVAWTTHEDLAEAAAMILKNSASLNGISPNLTALEAIDLEQIARIASELTGRSIRRTVVQDDKYEATMMGRGLPVERVKVMMGLFRASRRGEFSKVDPALGKLLGRPPTTMRDVLAAIVHQKNAESTIQT